MKYENVDEATRREACEKVKQIVKAIKAIKIKYYLNFSNISAKDKETYQKLEASLEKISENNGLNNLKDALMSEVYKKYGIDIKDDDKRQEGKQDPEDRLKACYGAIDAQKEALLYGRIVQALRCQEQLKKYKQELNSIELQEITIYKREKFAELMLTREQIEEQTKLWNNQFKGMYKIKHTEKRKEAMNEILQQTKPIKSTDEKAITI